MTRAAVVEAVIDPQVLIATVADAANGATAVFLGTVRSSNDGREVTGIEYSAYREMAESEMGLILEEASDRFGANAAIVHRIGTLAVGDVSIAVATASPHRRPAMDALHYIVEAAKSRAPIWKLEHYADGTREWVGASSSSGV